MLTSSLHPAGISFSSSAMHRPKLVNIGRQKYFFFNHISCCFWPWSKNDSWLLLLSLESFDSATHLWIQQWLNWFCTFIALLNLYQNIRENWQWPLAMYHFTAYCLSCVFWCWFISLICFCCNWLHMFWCCIDFFYDAKKSLFHLQ